MKEIKLKNGQNALVDDDDFEALNKYRWYLNGSYASAVINHKTVYMHRLIINAKKGQTIDHINGQGLDNRKTNLRFATCGQQMQNSKKRNRKKVSSIYKGVRKLRNLNTWNVRIGNIEIGCFDDELVSAFLYDYHARIKYKNFARLNFPNLILDDNAYHYLLEHHKRKGRWQNHESILRKPSSKVTLGS